MASNNAEPARSSMFVCFHSFLFFLVKRISPAFAFVPFSN